VLRRCRSTIPLAYPATSANKPPLAQEVTGERDVCDRGVRGRYEISDERKKKDCSDSAQGYPRQATSTSSGLTGEDASCDPSHIWNLDRQVLQSLFELVDAHCVGVVQ